MFRKLDTHIHFIGIGGIGMSGIAEVLLNLGYAVTGTDLASNDNTQRLAALGARVHRGHDASHLDDADVVVISSAVTDANPEVAAARSRRIPVIPRAEMLAELMRLKAALLIAGSHGKTTTTSLVASALHHGGRDPTVVIGGKVNAFASNARLGAGELFVAEADESDGSFLCLTPTVAVITNIDREHMDHYGSSEALLDAFVGFANRVPFYGQCIVCHDDANVRAILPRLTKRTVTYGIDEGADYQALDIEREGTRTRFRVRAGGRELGEFELAMPGMHNVRNALAAIAVCDGQQLETTAIREALAGFAGVQRRFTPKGEAAGVRVIDDYAHHPTELRATLAAARGAFPDARIVAIVQPHRYTRLRDHFAEFSQCMHDADRVYVTPVHAAGEAEIPGFDGPSLARAIGDAFGSQGRDRVAYHPDLETLPQTLATALRENDVVLTLGAGSITRLGPRIIEAIEARAKARGGENSNSG